MRSNLVGMKLSIGPITHLARNPVRGISRPASFGHPFHIHVERVNMAHPAQAATWVLPVLDVSTGVTTVFIVGVAVSIAVIALIVSHLAMPVVTAVAAGRAERTGGKSKNTCDHDVTRHPIEGIHGLISERSAKRMNSRVGM